MAFVILNKSKINATTFFLLWLSLALLSFFWPFRSPPLGEFYQEIFVFFSILLAAISLSAGRVYLNSSFFLLLSIFLWLVVQWFLGIYVFDSDFFSVSFYFFSFLVAIILGYSFCCYIRKFEIGRAHV